MTIAVVLGAGGSAALGWQTGVLAGLADQGVDIPPGVRVVGTSAGALLAGRRCSGATPAELVGLLGRRRGARTAGRRLRRRLLRLGAGGGRSLLRAGRAAEDRRGRQAGRRAAATTTTG